MLLRPTASRSIARTVLIVDDDPATCLTFGEALRLSGLRVDTAETGQAALKSLRCNTFDLLLLDLRLPDMSGLDLVRITKRVPFILISGFLTTAETVEAMRLGARDVLEKPVDAEGLSERVLSLLDARSPSPRSSEPVPASLPGLSDEAVQGRSAAVRWARFVIDTREAQGDMPTLAEWARQVGVSSATLRDACRVVRLSAHDSRDLARAIRALVNGRLEGCAPDLLLDMHDARTLQAFVERAGYGALSGDNLPHGVPGLAEVRAERAGRWQRRWYR